MTIFSIVHAFGQIGINTDSPKSTLHIEKGKITSNPDGVIVPRFDVSALAAKDGQYENDQDGTLVFITSETAGSTAKTVNILEKGFYFYDSVQSVWVAVGSYAGGQPLAAWVRNPAGQKVELAVKSDGSSRAAGTEFMATDNGNVGIGTATPNDNAMLEVTSSNKGVLLPRLSTSERDLIPATLANGLLIYNTTQNCFNYYDGSASKWLSLCGTAAPAKFTLQDCSTSPSGPAGTYKAGTALTSANTYTISVNVSEPGNYTMAANTTNGYSFTKSGTFTQTGIKTIILDGQGTPATGPGTDTVSLTFNGISVASSCSTISVTGNTTSLKVNCAGLTKSGIYTKGFTVTSANYIDVPITSITTPGTVTITTNSANGMTFSSGSVNITAATTSIRLYAQGTPANTDNATLYTYTFTAPGSTACSFGVAVGSTIGVFNNPAPSCQAIYNEFNSSGTLVANDGEYWIGTSAANQYKTKCDMVDAAEATALDKEVGGYTLLMSYSEGVADTKNRFGTNGIFNWSGTTLDNTNVVITQTGTLNYNEFRIATAEKTRWAGKATREVFTDQPTNANIPLPTYLKYPASNIITGSFSEFRGASALTVTGKYFGKTFNIVGSTNGTARLTLDGILISNYNMFYNTTYNNHWDQGLNYYAPTITSNGNNNAIISNWPMWVVAEYVNVMPFGYCVAGITSVSINGPAQGGYPSKTMTDVCLPNNTNLGRHPGVNGTEGYVLQWWAK